MKNVICPTCQKSSPWEGNAWRPFCSEACKSRDLGNWATERYRVPVHEWDGVPEEDDITKKNNREE